MLFLCLIGGHFSLILLEGRSAQRFCFMLLVGTPSKFLRIGSKAEAPCHIDCLSLFAMNCTIYPLWQNTVVYLACASLTT